MTLRRQSSFTLWRWRKEQRRPRRSFCHDVDLFAFKNQIDRTLFSSLTLALLSSVGRAVAGWYAYSSTDETQKYSPASQSSSRSLIPFLFPSVLLLCSPHRVLTVGDNARQFLCRLLPQRRTMDPSARLSVAASLPVFLHPSYLVSLPLSSGFLLRPRGPFSPSFRDVFLALRLAASLFPASSPGRGLLCAIRTQPLAYNETENLRGTRGMRRMITYIETENRPARRSAARSLFLFLSFFFLYTDCLTASLRGPKISAALPLCKSRWSSNSNRLEIICWQSEEDHHDNITNFLNVKQFSTAKFIMNEF